MSFQWSPEIITFKHMEISRPAGKILISLTSIPWRLLHNYLKCLRNLDLLISSDPQPRHHQKFTRSGIVSTDKVTVLIIIIRLMI